MTTAIPYVNAKPHIGHALEYIQADVIARTWRQDGDIARWQWGTDDNSLKNVRAAQTAGEETEVFVARHAEEFKKLKDVLNLSFDDFMRTRDDRHIRGAQKVWSMFKSEDVYKKAYSGLYCVGCETFYTSDEAPEGLCQIHKKPLEEVSEENYFFRLSAYQEQLETLITNDTIRITPETRKNEMLGFIRQGLQDFSISRSVARAEHWGVPVPADASQVMYVWVDALSQYITALGFADDGTDYKTYWENADERLHVIGKDIVRFHAIYWPAFLLSAGLPLPTDLFVHGFFTVNGEKMSKSLGNVLDPIDLVNDFGVDATRYAFLKLLPFGSDGDISVAKMEECYAELANGVGNLVSRVAAMVNKNFPEGIERVMFGPTNAVVVQGESSIDLSDTLHEAKETLRAFDFRLYIERVSFVINEANIKIDKEAPFKLVKVDRDAAKKSLSELAAMIRWIGEALAPIMPATAQEIARRYAGDVIVVGDGLFPRRDQ